MTIDHNPQSFGANGREPSSRTSTEASTASVRELVRPGGRLAYEVSGPADAPLVVCVPGMGDLRQAYRFTTSLLLAAGYRVAVLDQRGHGDSSVPWAQYGSRATGEDLLALIQELGGPAVIVGHSSAAGSAVWAAAERPTAVRSIVLAGPFREPAQLGLAMKGLAAVVGRSPWLWANMYYPSLYKAAKPADFAAYRRSIRTNLSQPGRMASVRAILGVGAADCYARISELGCPVLLLMGSEDPEYPTDATTIGRADEQAFGAVAPTTLTVLEGAGHYPHAEVPERVVAAIRDFLDAQSDRNADA